MKIFWKEWDAMKPYQEQWRWLERPRFELWMELCSHKIGVIRKLNNLHSRPTLIFANERQPSSFKKSDMFRIDFKPVSVPLIDMLVCLQVRAV